MWRLDCRLKYVCYLLVIKFVIFSYFWGKIRLFLRSLWRALHWNATTPPLSSVIYFFVCQQNVNNRRKKITDIFVWRLDCRLKYVYYLLLTKFVIFDYFSGKMHLFLRSLWRALHWNATTPPCLLLFFSGCNQHNQKTEVNTR